VIKSKKELPYSRNKVNIVDCGFPLVALAIGVESNRCRMGLEENYRLAWEELRTVTDLESLSGYLQKLLAPYGLTHAVYHSSHTPGRIAEEPLLVLTYTQAWIDRYISQNYFRIDPVVAAGSVGRLPFDWSSLPRHDPAARKFFGEAGEFGVGRHGLTIPIRGDNNERALFSVTSNMLEAEWKGLLPEFIRDFNTIAYYIHDRAIEFRDPENAEKKFLKNDSVDFLTARERQCLAAYAKGRNVERIADDLKISVRVVRMHLYSAQHRLRALNIPHAVAKAVAVGIVTEL
jgi:DNA-binding CsgD family transcriptional regulator